MLSALCLALCGALGLVLGFCVVTGLGRLQLHFPWGTLMVNLVGSAAIGVAMGFFAAAGALDSRQRVAITAGLLGGFTTMSSFAFESYQLWLRRPLWAAGYVAATVTLSIGLCVGGVALGRAWGRTW